jgi:DNA-binding NtrC family response regulator
VWSSCSLLWLRYRAECAAVLVVQALGDIMASAVSVAGDPKPEAAGSTILVVEDEILVRLMIAEELRGQDYNVREAASADEARSVLQSRVKIDLVLTDIWMPGSIDGAGLVQLIRVQRPALKVVLASGHQPETALVDRVDGFFLKPYDVAKLLQHIRALVD